ncbi:MAG TPA: hypothetical protein VFO86_15795, partial [Terriglobia bacterium]|nr:hypothetical protein [Terriglobia bacterium]
MNLISGDYKLSVFATNGTTGAYSFRLLDLAAAIPIAQAATVNGALTPANGTNLYRFNIVGGEKIYFDVTARNGGSSNRWRLLDPYLNVVFERDFNNTNSDTGPMTLTRAGTYTLEIEGRYFETGTSSYSFILVPVSDELNPVPMTLGSTINEAIDEQGETDSYTFNLANASQLYFDSLTDNGQFFWSLIGPAGTAVSSRSFQGSDSIDGNSTMNLIAGNYTLSVFASNGSTGNYSFRLLDLAAATPISPAATVSGALTPANETDLYRFNIVGGESMFFDVTSRSGGGSARWRLMDPYLNVVFERDFASTGSDFGPVTLTRAGTYTLAIEGRYFETGTTTYSFVVNQTGTTPVPPFPTGTPLALNSTVSDAIGVAGEQDVYTFTLPGNANLYFDVLSPSDGNFVWSLLGPAGTVISGRPFSASDSHDIG